MKTLLLGANGQVGWELARVLAPKGELIACDRATADLEDLDGLRELIRLHEPEIVINAAAYTGVDKAELEPGKARQINSTAVGVMADEVGKLDALLVHYSTDYVFDGKKPLPYVETDERNPISVYGKTKLEGERAIEVSGCRHLIFRTSWVYGERGPNFLRTILRLAQERESLDIVSDQIGAPTSVGLIAEVTVSCLDQIARNHSNAGHPQGVFHLTPVGQTSWHGFAAYILELAEARGMDLMVRADQVHPITSDQYAGAAIRPKNSKLSTEKLSREFGITLPDWRCHVDELIATMMRQECG